MPRWLPAILLAPVLLSCSSILGGKDPHLPGDGIGVYKLEATIDATSTCTELLASAPRPWVFDVTLRRDHAKAYWMASAEAIDGSIDDGKGAMTFHSTSQTDVHGVDKKRQVGACSIVRTDDFTGAFAGPTSAATPTAPATSIASFTGTLHYTYAIAAGSDCSDVVGVASAERPTPIFAALPCQAHFAVTATRTGDAPK